MFLDKGEVNGVKSLARSQTHEMPLQKINCLNNGKESLEPGLRAFLSFSLFRSSFSPFHQSFSNLQNRPIACHLHVSNPNRIPTLLFPWFYATRFFASFLWFLKICPILVQEKCILSFLRIKYDKETSRRDLKKIICKKTKIFIVQKFDC